MASAARLRPPQSGRGPAFSWQERRGSPRRDVPRPTTRRGHSCATSCLRGPARRLPPAGRLRAQGHARGHPGPSTEPRAVQHVSEAARTPWRRPAFAPQAGVPLGVVLPPDPRLRWFNMPSALLEDGTPLASLDRLKARAAPTTPRAQPRVLGSLRWPQQPTSGRPKVEDSSIFNHQEPVVHRALESDMSGLPAHPCARWTLILIGTQRSLRARLPVNGAWPALVLRSPPRVVHKIIQFRFSISWPQAPVAGPAGPTMSLSLGQPHTLLGQPHTGTYSIALSSDEPTRPNRSVH